MNVEIKYNSPLRFLDYDVSQYLYENYFPSSKAKDKKKTVNDQYNYYLNNYLQHYNLNNIYERNMIICIRRNLYRRLSFSYYLNLNNKIKYIIKKRHLKNKKTLSEQRAIDYKMESIKIFKNL